MEGFTEQEIQTLEHLYENWGRDLRILLNEGEIDLAKLRYLELPHIFSSHLDLAQLFCVNIAPENAGIMSNSAVVATAFYTGGSSALQFSITRNLVAKKFYLLSFAFSSAALTNGSIAVLSRAFELSQIGVLSEVLAAGFLWLGNSSHSQALRAEGKPIPNKFKNSIKRPKSFFNSNDDSGVAFVVPQGLNSVQIKTIAQIFGIGLTIYTYWKIMSKIYKYCKQFIIKRKKNNDINLRFYDHARFLVISLYNCSSLSRTKIIYNFAISRYY